MFRAGTLSKRSFIEEAVKCLLQELINAGHSIRMCLTATEPHEYSMPHSYIYYCYYTDITARNAGQAQSASTSMPTNLELTAARDNEGGNSDKWNYENYVITCIY